jgi:hypothetical protein
VCTIDHIKTLLKTVHKLSEDVAVLKSDNVSLKSQINKLHEKVGQPPESLPTRVGLQTDKEIAGPPKAAPRQNQTRSYAAVAVSGPAHKLHLAKNLLIGELSPNDASASCSFA